ncbi:MAG TPA: hypothetical protein VN428_16790 [Bryobacteraceae bacterium]|nr:hypothetical protein [Bryobacteraceae bacterium]
MTNWPYTVGLLSFFALLMWLAFASHRAAQEQHSNALRLLAYAQEIREVAFWSALLGANLEHARSAVSWIEPMELMRWRDDGAAYAAALAIGLIKEIESQQPSLQKRLGLSPVSGEDRKRVEAVFTGLMGRQNEGAHWATRDDPTVTALREFLARRTGSA